MKNVTDGLTIEQKLWKGAGAVWYSLKPLLLYLCFPAILMCFGMLLFGGRDAEGVLASSRNFYSALGIILTLVILHRRGKKRGSSLFEEAALECRGLARKRLFLLVGMGFGLAVVFSALFLGERITLSSACALLLIIGGVMVSQFYGRR